MKFPKIRLPKSKQKIFDDLSMGRRVDRSDLDALNHAVGRLISKIQAQMHVDTLPERRQWVDEGIAYTSAILKTIEAGRLNNQVV